MIPLLRNSSAPRQAFGAELSRRLMAIMEPWSAVACVELGLPTSFVREQLAYAARCLPDVDGLSALSAVPGDVAFLFPANTEGAMATYLIALAHALGFRVHAKISRRCPGIQACLEDLFAGAYGVRFYADTGPAFLSAMLQDSQVRFVQVFGDDAWINPYEGLVRATGKTLAFDGPGKDPVVVLPGVDLQAAVQAAIDSGLFAGGAACMSAERFLIHESLTHPFVESLSARLARIRPLPPDRPEAVLGYLYSRRAAERIREQVVEAVERGARMVLAGSVEPVIYAGREFFACAPIVLDQVPADAQIVSVETFGPVFPIQSFSSLEEAMALAERCPYGLTATVVGPTPAAQALAQRLRASHAVVYANQTLLDGFEPDHWGCGGYKRSGWVWETVGGHFRVRHGYRPLRLELQKLRLQINKEEFSG